MTSNHLPMERIVSNGTGRALGGGVIADILQLLVNPFESHDGLVHNLAGKMGVVTLK